MDSEMSKWVEGPFFLAPYDRQNGLYDEKILIELFNRLKGENLYDTVFHDNPGTSLLQFMNIFSNEGVLLQIINYIKDGKIVDLAAMSWLSGVEIFADARQRAVAAFVVFDAYQRPDLTNMMASLVFKYWFKTLGMNVVSGMTPAANEMAVHFIKRIGFKEVGRVRNYSAFKGKATDCVVTYLDREIYFEKYGG